MVEEEKHYSVLMSVYGKEKPDFLRDSMESIYSQTITTDDFVLICDGPLTKGLDEVIEAMKQMFGEKLRVIRLEENHGLGYALSVGVKECKNELIARMDSDDISVADRIEKQLRALAKHNVDVIGSNIAEYDGEMKNVTGYREVPAENSEIVKMMKKRNAVNHVTTIYKKSKVLEAGNYVGMLGFEDYYLWVRMLQNGCKFYNVQANLVQVRCGDEMIKRRGGYEYIKRIRKFEKAIYDLGFISRANYLMNMVERVFASIIPDSARSLLYKKVLRK